METSTMIRQLRRTAKKHENDKLHTFDTNISQMCTDVANRIEELEKENREIRNKAIDEFYDKVLNFEDYIEPVSTYNSGTLQLYSGRDITKMIKKIAEEMRGAE